MLEILEPIKVWVFFSGRNIKPYLFFWKDRQIKIDKINLIHTSRVGVSVFYHFSVSAQSNFYRLKFDTHKMNWFLEYIEE